jgi:hypothetical protein
MNDYKNKADTLRGLPEWRPIVNRDDVLVWLTAAGLVAVCGAAIWVLSLPARDIFG